MLARILGIGEDAAATKLAQSFTITAGPAEGSLFGEELHEELERTLTAAPAEGGCDLEIVIHASPARASARQLFVAITADAVTVSRSPLPFENAPPLHGVQRVIGACFAASVAIATLIENIEFASAADPFNIRFDALGATRDVLSVPIRLDDTVLVGAGAVGNGFLRAARHLAIEGELTVADPKAVGGGNPNRCLYFMPGDNGQKAETLAARAQPDFPRLSLTPFVGTFADVVRKRGRVKRAIIGADSRSARRSVQADLPLEVIDASTTGAVEVIVHSHRQPNPDACLACIYRHIPDELARAKDIATGLGVELADVTSGNLIDAGVASAIAAKHPGLDEPALVGMAFDSLFKQLCAEQALLSASGEQVLAPFAFISNLAGALLALELARFEAGARFADGKNYLFASPWAPPHPHLRRKRPSIDGCEFCGDATTLAALRVVWPELRPGT
ncbi:ThiF family adenylyltransferase [Bradyrhizobium arachidis]|uniref:ThiF family adenylyltransferase n=1 Tax=Bradyrhizobium arachidis TaxID=858423 RepID=UPI002163F78E|nr:ThiF family adenylyltransferase [Bradyrhizobium arachidis]UVO28165.1 ThiF family adenylyltransferase [Bradyrhizobium arachidis]